MDTNTRNRLSFKYFFNSGLDRETLECDLEGSDVFYDGIYIGSVKLLFPSDLSKLTNIELDKVLQENGVNCNTKNEIIESWWRHNGFYDRAQATGIPYNGEADYLDKTDEWWNSLSQDEKDAVYTDFFAEY